MLEFAFQRFVFVDILPPNPNLLFYIALIYFAPVPFWQLPSQNNLFVPSPEDKDKFKGIF